MPAAIVATGIVLAVQVFEGPGWLPRTRVEFLGDDGANVTFWLPGANGGPPAAVRGIPVVAPGQRWRVELDEALVGLVPRGHELGMHPLGPQPVWNLNGNHLADDLLPWSMLLHEEGIAALGIETTEGIVQEAMAQWSRPGCSTFAFAYAGRTAAGLEEDGLNVMAWENEVWEWHPHAAGMSVVRFSYEGPEPEISETDILFNAVDFAWDADTGTMTGGTPTLHAGSIVAHELGHTTGMDHEATWVSSTMYYAYFGGSWMATLSGDDWRGVCENYPSGADACDDNEDCEGLDASERVCADRDGIRVCDEVRDPVGAECHIDAFNCEEVCLFDSLFYSQGQCVLTCPEGTCAEGFACTEAEYTIPLEAGPVCVPVAPDTGDTAARDTGPEDTEDTADEEAPEGCGCATRRGAGACLALVGLALARVRRDAYGSRRASIIPLMDRSSSRSSKDAVNI